MYGGNQPLSYWPYSASRSLYKFDISDTAGTIEEIYRDGGDKSQPNWLSGIAFGGCVHPSGDTVYNSSNSSSINDIEPILYGISHWHTIYQIDYTGSGKRYKNSTKGSRYAMQIANRENNYSLPIIEGQGLTNSWYDGYLYFIGGTYSGNKGVFQIDPQTYNIKVTNTFDVSWSLKGMGTFDKDYLLLQSNSGSGTLYKVPIDNSSVTGLSVEQYIFRYYHSQSITCGEYVDNINGNSLDDDCQAREPTSIPTSANIE